MGRVWYLIVSIPVLCSLSYFKLMSFLVLKGQGRESRLLYSVFLTSCSVALPYGAVCWSAVCDVVFPDHNYLRFASKIKGDFYNKYIEDLT